MSLRAIIGILHSIGSSEGDADFYTRNGSALAGVDYVAGKAVVSFADDQGRMSVAVALLNPGPKGGPRTVSLNLRNPTGGAVKGTRRASSFRRRRHVTTTDSGVLGT